MPARFVVRILFDQSLWCVSGAATALWGFAFGALPVGAQTWIIRAAPEYAESAGGLLLTTFQVATVQWDLDAPKFYKKYIELMSLPPKPRQPGSR